MSFDLFVLVPALSDDVQARWQEELALGGLICEFSSGFDVTHWTGGMVPIKLEVALQEKRDRSTPPCELRRFLGIMPDFGLEFG